MLAEPSFIKRRLARGFVISLGLGLALLLHELGGRLLLGANWSPEDGLASNALLRTESGLHATKPNLDRETFANLSRRTQLYTDASGCRVPGPDSSRPENPKEEILIIGASNTWGMGVSAEDSWPFVFEKLLSESGHAVRVHNASGVGYSLPIMLSRAQELTESRHFDQVFIVTPSTGLYMFGIGSLGQRGHFAGFQPHQVDLLALEYPFNERPEIEEKAGWLLMKERPGRGGLMDFLRTSTLVGHRLVVKLALRNRRLQFDESGPEADLSRSLAIASGVGQGWKNLENRLFTDNVGLYHVFLPAEWQDLKLENDDFQRQVMTAFQSVAQVGKRYYGRLDMSGDPVYKLAMDSKPGGDFLPDGRHLSSHGHARVAAQVARWYQERILPRLKKR